MPSPRAAAAAAAVLWPPLCGLAALAVTHPWWDVVAGFEHRAWWAGVIHAVAASTAIGAAAVRPKWRPAAASGFAE